MNNSYTAFLARAMLSPPFSTEDESVTQHFLKMQGFYCHSDIVNAKLSHTFSAIISDIRNPFTEPKLSVN